MARPQIRAVEAQTLKAWLAEGRPVYLLDVRTPEEHAEWRIPGSHHVPLDRLLADTEGQQLPRDREIVTICAHGARAERAAAHLLSRGFRALVLQGGMSAWNTVYDPAELRDALPGSGRVIQIRRPGKGCVSYLVASGQQAAVVDPPCRIEPILEVAERLGVRITHILDTHQHADHVSGARRLQALTGATLHLSPQEGYGFTAFEPLVDGQEIRVGALRLRPIHAPGHTIGSMLIEIDNRLLLTGDTLFVDGVGRPDLRDRAEEFAALLYQTYHSILRTLPGHLLVLPGHTGPEQPLRFGEPIVAPLQELRRRIPLFRTDRETFVRYVVERVPQRPPNTQVILQLNREGVLCNPPEAEVLELGPNRCAVPAAPQPTGR